MLISALGCQIDLAIDGNCASQALRAIQESWSWCVQERTTFNPTAAEVTLRVVLDDRFDVVHEASAKGDIASSRLDVLMHRLAQEVTRVCIDHQAGHLLMLHACAVADPVSGRALAAVGPSGTGKTTFVRTLGSGRAYLSDETVGLHADQRVVPYLKPLSVNSGNAEGFKDQVTPAFFGLLAPPPSTSLVDLWFLHRVDQPMTPRVERLGTLDALTTIAPQVSYLSSTPSPLRRLAATFDAVGGLKLVTYHEVADLEPVVARTLAGDR